MEKVILSREAADAVELARNDQSRSFVEIVEHRMADVFHKELDPLNSLHPDTLIRALYIGYEVEQTPEDKVKVNYDVASVHIKRLNGDSEAEYWKGVREGIRSALGSLEIKIKGVNDN